MCDIALVMVKERGKQSEYLRFTDGDSANIAIRLLNKQPNVSWAVRMTDTRADHLTYLLSQ